MYQNNVVILVARAIDTPHLASLPAVFRSDPSMDDKKIGARRTFAVPVGNI
jgi:hypothetical protein